MKYVFKTTCSRSKSQCKKTSVIVEKEYTKTGLVKKKSTRFFRPKKSTCTLKRVHLVTLGLLPVVPCLVCRCAIVFGAGRVGIGK